MKLHVRDSIDEPLESLKKNTHKIKHIHKIENYIFILFFLFKQTYFEGFVSVLAFKIYSVF